MRVVGAARYHPGWVKQMLDCLRDHHTKPAPGAGVPSGSSRARAGSREPLAASAGDHPEDRPEPQQPRAARESGQARQTSGWFPILASRAKPVPARGSAFVALATLVAACSGAPAPRAASAPARQTPAPASGGAYAHHHATTAHHRFRDAASWAKVFDDPARDAWQRPDEVVRALRLAPDAMVADLGAGTGYFTVRLARAVPQGRVLAIDIEPDMLDWVKRRAAHAGLANVETVLASPDDPHLATNVDLVLIVDTYHHLSNRSAYFRALASHLSAHGRVAIVDFRMGHIPVGPPESMRVAPDAVAAEMKDAGLAPCGRFDGLAYQYLLFFGVTC